MEAERGFTPATIDRRCVYLGQFLLRHGVTGPGEDINTIRVWLGHVSLDTTNVYAEVDLEMKAKALAHCEIFTSGHASNWKELPDLMAFPKSV
jgi:integrase